jgi:cation diffusion facilitator CzcD-associated flavoprotein CzcO
MDQAHVVVIGAGPHGLAATAHLRRAGVEVVTFGDPMDFWRTMPEGMLLRSNWTATSIAEHVGPLSLTSYCASTGADIPRPVPLEEFIEYGAWVAAAAAPDVDRRRVASVEQQPRGFVVTLADGERIAADKVVVAGGIAPFVNRPEVAAHLPRELASHTADHRGFGSFSGKQVLVVGGGQSALECAALLREAGASVEVCARARKINWLHGAKYHQKLGRLEPLAYAPTDVGPMGISRIVSVPDLFRRLPRPVQDRMAYRAIRPAGADWLRPRLAEVPIQVDRPVVAADARRDRVTVRLGDGSSRVVDHVMFGTGYRVDISKYPFLQEPLTRRIQQVHGYPVLRRGLESSVHGLHFMGAPAAWSFGPVMRFVCGGWYGGASVTQRLAGAKAPAAPVLTASADDP